MKKNLKIDALVWVAVICVASIIAFSLLRRDAQRHFGAVSFGSYPEFGFLTVDKGYIDRHLFKGHVWAVHNGADVIPLASTMKRLSSIAEQTASGKRHLYILTLSDTSSMLLKPQKPFQYVVFKDNQHSPNSFQGKCPASPDMVWLIDQNAIIRGQYNINDLQDFKKFQQDLIRIL